jgi:hypothetical protein
MKQAMIDKLAEQQKKAYEDAKERLAQQIAQQQGLTPNTPYAASVGGGSWQTYVPFAGERLMTEDTQPAPNRAELLERLERGEWIDLSEITACGIDLNGIDTQVDLPKNRVRVRPLV